MNRSSWAWQWTFDHSQVKHVTRRNVSLRHACQPLRLIIIDIIKMKTRRSSFRRIPSDFLLHLKETFWFPFIQNLWKERKNMEVTMAVVRRMILCGWCWDNENHKPPWAMWWFYVFSLSKQIPMNYLCDFWVLAGAVAALDYGVWMSKVSEL